MPAILVDSNVLLDLLTEDADWFAWSSQAVEHGADHARLVIDQVILRKCLCAFHEELDTVLSQSMIDRESIPYEAVFLAGKAFAAYRRHGGLKRSPLPDFFIGAHAAVAGYRLMTRDAPATGPIFRRSTSSPRADEPQVGETLLEQDAAPSSRHACVRRGASSEDI